MPSPRVLPPRHADGERMRVHEEGGVLTTPLRPYRFFAAFFLPPAAFFAAFFAISPPGAVAAQRAHRYRVVTTGGLSGPPSYKM